MIDKETAIQWAKDAGIWVDSHGHSIVSTTEALHALITRAQNEAYEKAAQQVDFILKTGGGTYGDSIRSLKQDQP